MLISAAQFDDRRSKKVVFLSHCILNENTRYLGGACTGGAIGAVVQPYLDQQIGIVQLPCPEQHAWGGVLKRRMFWFVGARGAVCYRLRFLLLPLIRWYTQAVYRKLARSAADQILDYLQSGFSVCGIVGIDGSPSCGVARTIELGDSLRFLAQLPCGRLHAADMNSAVCRLVTSGRGLFIVALQAELQRRGVSVSFSAHDLLAEIDGSSRAQRSPAP